MEFSNILIIVLPFIILCTVAINETNASRKRRNPTEPKSGEYLEAIGEKFKPQSQKDESSSNTNAKAESSSNTNAKAESSSNATAKAESSSNTTEKDEPLNGFKIVCPYPAKEFYRSGCTPEMINPHICTHVHYEFAKLDAKTHLMKPGEPDLDTDMGFMEECVKLKKKNPKLKVMLSLGGWEDSTEKYSKMMESEEKREKFCSEAIIFLKEKDFDGIDLSFQYPNCWQGACGVQPHDKQNFEILVTKCCEEMHKNKLLCSISVAAIKKEFEAAYVDVPKLSKAVDYINVMAYDMHGPWEKETHHLAPMTYRPGDKNADWNMKAALQLWETNGATKKKIVCGIPLYAKTYTTKEGSPCEIGATAFGPGKPGEKTMTAGMLSYTEVCQMINKGNWTVKKDEHAGYFMCDGDQWICFDSPMQVVAKTYFLFENGYGGVHLKNVCNDDPEGRCFSTAIKFPLVSLAFKVAYFRCLSTYQKYGHV